MPVYPAPGRDVGNRVDAADDEIPPRQMVFQYLVVPLRLPPVAVARVVEPLRGGELEMNRLAGEGPETGSDEKQPGEQLGPVGGAPMNFPALSPR